MTRKSWADLKKMWITYDEGGAPLDVFYKEHPGAVGWVRADLVDGLVEALEETIRKMSAFIYLANEVGINDADGFYLAHAIETEAKARAALKAMEDDA